MDGNLAARRQRRATKKNRAALADMVFKTESEEPERDRCTNAQKEKGDGRELCWNLYHEATVSGLNPNSMPEATCPNSAVPRWPTNAFANSVVFVDRDPAAAVAWRAFSGCIRQQPRCDLLWRACAERLASISLPARTEAVCLRRRNADDRLPRSLRDREGLIASSTGTWPTARTQGRCVLLPFLADATATKNGLGAADE